MNTELAWAAGFYDGEGCTSLRKYTNGTIVLECSLGQKDRRPLERFVRAVGFGKVNGPYGVAQAYQIHYIYGQAYDLLDRLWPYLSEPKREQARSKGYKGY